MIRDPYARRKTTEKTPEQLRQIKLQNEADERRRLKREAEVRKRRDEFLAKRKADAERKAHRRAQQEERERLAMQDAFENPDDDEEYDPFAFGFDNESKLRF